MKYLLTMLIISFATIFGCGDNDNIASTKTDNIVYQNDSLGITTTESGVVSLNNLISIDLDSNTEYRIEFDGSTNLPDSICLYGLAVYQTDGFVYTINEIIAVNSHHSFMVSNVTNKVNFNVYISYINPAVINQYGIAYLWFLNIKVYVV